ncbi:hypothetical protein MKZ08_04470 [Viridibacillus sp. FSL R5-0477]|uniref:Uncharacterized protein n=1 Tax=Viridibacillus arenosi FSL R5-213 TaxID=1227360 RepID=W4ESB7_9BACL|nr:MULTISPECIES: hypothetical protein [Viridibacillus]ETT82696.1 hypothetical protein C176_16947 [Viridibacillus arenosi FSL R5-213]OMC82329.1 hypothetical protein BK128_20180 [Viridibacillus sp. FSL H7-0596]OMC92232.1 hypothetical protein BK137_04045 [Viridibacillus arenosi]
MNIEEFKLQLKSRVMLSQVTDTVCTLLQAKNVIESSIENCEIENIEEELGKLEKAYTSVYNELVYYPHDLIEASID